MDRFTKILHKSINTLSGLGAVVLAIVMLIIFANIIVRIFGKVVIINRTNPKLIEPNGPVYMKCVMLVTSLHKDSGNVWNLSRYIW